MGLGEKPVNYCYSKVGELLAKLELSVVASDLWTVYPMGCRDWSREIHDCAFAFPTRETGCFTTVQQSQAPQSTLTCTH